MSFLRGAQGQEHPSQLGVTHCLPWHPCPKEGPKHLAEGLFPYPRPQAHPDLSLNLLAINPDEHFSISPVAGHLTPHPRYGRAVRDWWRGKSRRSWGWERSLRGLKQLIKKSHPSAPAGNDHPHEDKRVWASLSSFVSPNPPSSLRAGFHCALRTAQAPRYVKHCWREESGCHPVLSLLSSHRQPFHMVAPIHPARQLPAGPLLPASVQRSPRPSGRAGLPLYSWHKQRHLPLINPPRVDSSLS